MGDTGWRLSPAYDLDPVPAEIKPRTLSTTITFDSSVASLELALEVAEEFGLKPNQAKAVVREVCAAVAQWKPTAKQMGIIDKAIAKMASAFEHSDLELARKI